MLNNVILITAGCDGRSVQPRLCHRAVHDAVCTRALVGTESVRGVEVALLLAPAPLVAAGVRRAGGAAVLPRVSRRVAQLVSLACATAQD